MQCLLPIKCGYIFCCHVISTWPCECPFVDILKRTIWTCKLGEH
jgi:hypothetical protein